jgi:hypothetical protein
MSGYLLAYQLPVSPSSAATFSADMVRLLAPVNRQKVLEVVELLHQCGA